MENNSLTKETKKCPFCAEEIKAEAKKCKHCGEMLDGSKDKSTKFEIIEKKYGNWLLAKTNGQFSIISSNETDNFIIVQRKHASFSFFIFIILFICFVIPALLYLFTLRQKAETFTIFINIDTGEVNSKDFDGKFLGKHPYYWIIKNYNNSLK